jgi:hypothetical protein
MISNLILKTINYYKNNGFFRTLLKISFYFIYFYKKYIFYRKVASNKNIEEKFTWIYRNNFWDNGESISGKGSTLYATKNIRLRLPEIVIKYKINTIFDAPCGDLNWMKLLLPTLNVKYIGADIVDVLVNKLNETYSDERTKFIIDDYDYEDGYVVVVYKLDITYKKDFKLIKEGKYSQTSKKFQALFPKTMRVYISTNTFETKTTLQYRIFNKTEDLKEFWEEKLGVEFDDSMEVWQGFIEENETLSIDKLKEQYV